MSLESNIPKKESEFAKKYGLKGKGKPVRISQKTKDYIQVLHRQAERIIEAGKDYAQLEKRTFGYN